MQRPIVFLDFDGVLVPEQLKTEGVELQFSSTAIAALNCITEESGADLVISSTWRFFHSQEEICQMLREEGVLARVVGFTPVEFPEEDEPTTRGEEIDYWLRRENYTGKLLVLDDDDMMAPLEAFHVQPESRIGLTPEHVEEALRLLKQQ